MQMNKVSWTGHTAIYNEPPIVVLKSIQCVWHHLNCREETYGIERKRILRLDIVVDLFM
jgi:hypothetical protein